MRLVCPSCAATYEVDAAMIPAEGRDVQCAACTHVWFQEPVAVKVPLVLSTPLAQADEPAEEPAASQDLSASEDDADQDEDHDSPSAPYDRETDTETAADAPEPAADAAAPAPVGMRPAEPAAPGGKSSGDSFADRLRASMLDAEPEPEPEPEANPDEPVAARMAVRSDDDEADMDRAMSGASIHALPMGSADDAPTSAEENEDLLQSLREQLGDTDDEFRDANPRSRRRNVVEAAANAGMDTKKLLAPEKKSRLAISPDLARELKEERRAAAAAPRRRRSLGFAASLIVGLGVWYTYAMSETLAASYPVAAPMLDTLVATVDTARTAIEAGMGWATAMIAKFTAA